MYLWRGRDAYPSSVDGQARVPIDSVKTGMLAPTESRSVSFMARRKPPSQSVSQCHPMLRPPVLSRVNDIRRVSCGRRRACAETYGLETIAGSIEDRPDNTTRFLVIGKQSTESSGIDKTSVLSL